MKQLPMRLSTCILFASFSIPAFGQFWNESAILPAPNPTPGGQFGHNLTLSGNTLAVTHRALVPFCFAPNAAAQASEIHIFERNQGVQGTWKPSATITTPIALCAGLRVAGFGHAVELDSDTLVVSAPWADPAQDAHAHERAGGAKFQIIAPHQL